MEEFITVHKALPQEPYGEKICKNIKCPVFFTHGACMQQAFVLKDDRQRFCTF